MLYGWDYVHLCEPVLDRTFPAVFVRTRFSGLNLSKVQCVIWRGKQVVETAYSPQDKAFERRERVLQTYYERLNNLDKSIRELTNFFFGINMAIFTLVFQVIKNDPQRFLLALVGYCVSIAIYLTTYKSFLSWKLYGDS